MTSTQWEVLGPALVSLGHFEKKSIFLRSLGSCDFCKELSAGDMSGKVCRSVARCLSKLSPSPLIPEYTDTQLSFGFLRKGLMTSASVKSYDARRVDIIPMEQRRLTFDTHALVQDLQNHGFEKVQAETIVSALATLSNSSIETIYKDMVTKTQQEITLQQIMAHLDSIRKDMVILEKSEFATLRAENEKMKIELDQVKQQILNETGRIRADSKLDMNLERSRLADMFTEQQKKLMEASTDFHKKNADTDCLITEINKKIDIDIASLKTLMESHKLDTVRYLAASVFTCLAIALGFYRLWK
ncbi:coiled-coil domain-containing protein 90B, mitochondrial isoform X2 [Microcaecilia unicolor]|uniref:Coiled-coil domain-containing protein 90B, mitochondrial isoform X2 n=1 Tax=Microcaecilia unicolor TaxID=1415580 RepID=A0A6P7XTX4_9AMPH|nr:coiled-coil domain-containing protein 90B, mitochondrial isoform X2 [Microcaecilia unicolor]